ncbi:MSMEG_4193 family putative phosphomutase [Luteipulveratus sp. YIM 133132]|uniref:MSMEG_4193 family putative phosphomutase n=1 Tax=Luteipulveratus flavus TaxID=3031728 RepID=UPI0023AEB974|nr:MSMEG_4193 family putative phosphomutase [Luteipulveratus sp. YIM 133132]MDE9366517.1 MSMEG_4193 family putative phosphomutase [Luteipulveratus sp. YIM 133132]
MATVLLLRHGRTAANSSGVLAGWTEGVGLDYTGRDQAAAVGERLRDLPIVRVVTSPLQRCQETAAAVVGDRSVPTTTDVDLGECRYGAWTGRSIGELAKDPLWRVVQEQPSAVTFPESPDFAHESMAQMQARAVRAVRRIDAEVEAEHGPRAVWLAISHGDVIKAVLADALGTHLDLFQRISVSPASLSGIRYTTSRPFVVRINDNSASVADLVPREQQAASGDATPGGETGADERVDTPA